MLASDKAVQAGKAPVVNTIVISEHFQVQPTIPSWSLCGQQPFIGKIAGFEIWMTEGTRHSGYAATCSS